jgi:hypothetical protein
MRQVPHFPARGGLGRGMSRLQEVSGEPGNQYCDPGVSKKKKKKQIQVWVRPAIVKKKGRDGLGE